MAPSPPHPKPIPSKPAFIASDAISLVLIFLFFSIQDYGDKPFCLFFLLFLSSMSAVLCAILDYIPLFCFLCRAGKSPRNVPQDNDTDAM